MPSSAQLRPARIRARVILATIKARCCDCTECCLCSSFLAVYIVRSEIQNVGVILQKYSSSVFSVVCICRKCDQDFWWLFEKLLDCWLMRMRFFRRFPRRKCDKLAYWCEIFASRNSKFPTVNIFFRPIQFWYVYDFCLLIITMIHFEPCSGCGWHARRKLSRR